MSQRSASRRLGVIVVGLVLALTATACLPAHVLTLSRADFEGREAGTAGGLRAREYLLDALAPITEGVVAGQTGAAAHQQPFEGGVNVFGLVRGTERPDEIVVVGAHYDGLGRCRDDDGNPATDVICNGATDNATGVAVVLDLAQRLAEDPPSRSVLFAFWDAEEKGLAGSRHHATDPVVPFDQMVAYVNVDLVGANLLPGLSETSFAVGAETGGPALTSVVDDAIDTTSLGVVQLSNAFGANRSDHVTFVENQIPVVYFSDSTGGCYHTPEDDVAVVDWAKLGRQRQVVEATVLGLADGAGTPTFTSSPPATYDDLTALLEVVSRAQADLDRFPAETVADIEADRSLLAQIHAEGPAAFDSGDVLSVLFAALRFINAVSVLPCEAHVAG